MGQCEIKLKEEYRINDNDSLIYLKRENISSDEASQKKIEYDVFEPYNFSKLNLSIFDGENINIYVKLHLSEETKKIYENLKSMGYNMFDINDPFYQDICITYKSENNTDVILSDRINYIYNNKDSQCQPNCEFSSYLPNSLYLNCSCVFEEENNNKEETKFSGKKIYESFYDVLKYSNFKILKCYELVFKKNPFKNNIGSIIILCIFSFYCSCLIIYIIKGIIPLKNKIKDIIPKNEENKLEDKIKENQINDEKVLSNPLKKNISKEIINNDNNEKTKRKKIRKKRG